MPPSDVPADGGAPFSAAALKAVRKAALNVITAALDEVLVPDGFGRQTGKGLWVRNGTLARTYVEVQKSQSGLACYINLGREDAGSGPIPSYRNNTSWRLGQVARGVTIPKWRHSDSIAYADLAEDAALAAALGALVRDAGLPFLRSCQGPLGHTVRPPPAAPPGV